ncbi:MAG TPA: SGNH/GDSL hydrolase family protein, partial [Chroococcales cyanobacterium]
MKKYRLISVGDSLTQGFQSFAVFDRGQKYSFPNQIVDRNPDLFLPFRTPSIPYPGYPFNIEHFLNQLLEWAVAGANWKSRLKLAQGLMKDVASYSSLPHPRHRNRHHNLAVHGYTARDTYETTFRNRSAVIHKLLLRPPDALKSFNFSSLTDSFDSFNFARTTYRVLCGNPADVDRSSIDIACAICGEEERECLITYWAGNNDVLGALVSGDKRYITEPKITLAYIRKALERLLEYPNAKIVFATLPESTIAPFLDEKTKAPVFPVYETLSPELSLEIGNSIREINEGLKELFRSIGNPRLGLVEADRFFREISENGHPIQSGDGRNLCLTCDFIETDEKGRLRKGGLVSLDGIHPTASCYALVANAFIDQFREMGVDLEKVDVDATAAKDSLIVSPPALIPPFLDANSELRRLFAKI